ncbi:MAG: hypothetical protein AB8G17_04625 [Gammaproteobacteria bacterium]
MKPTRPTERRAAGIALATALVPAVAIHLCFLLAVGQGFIPSCVPYLEGCTSISSTGRHGAAYWLFKATMLPQAALLFFFWGWLANGLGHARVLRIVGRIGAAFLVLYVVFLGADNEIYRLMRRYGVFVYFIATFVAMVIASLRIRRRAVGTNSARILIVLCAAMLCLGLMEAPLGQFGLADNQAENLIEWNFALLMQSWFLVCWVMRTSLTLNPTPD